MFNIFKKRENKMSKLTGTGLAICAGLLATSSLAMAQIPQGNVYFGLGTAQDSSNCQALDPLGIGAFNNTPKMTGLFATVGGSFMVTPHYGVGAQYSWRTSSGNYSGVNYRPMFYDFNGVWQPIKTKRVVPEIQAGIGGAKVSFSANQQSCDQLIGCQTFNLGSESSSHFQVHMAAAARLYLTPRIFLRPAVDAHYVNNFFQFGSNWVPEYSLGVGYSFGGE
jgi:hypothetical protein